MEVQTRLADLPERPPTPPKESKPLPSSQDSNSAAGSPNETQPTPHTPNGSPTSTHTATASKSGERRSKRVGFRLSSSKHIESTSAASQNGSSSAKSNPPSRDTKPVKSILKPAKLPVADGKIEEGQSRDFPRMLEQFVQQLAGTDVSSRLDAYIALNDAIKTYKNGPEQRALTEKMSLLVSFIERDLQDTDSTSDADRTTTSRSTQLAAEVVKLVSTLLWSPIMCNEIPEQFQLFVLNKSIAVAGSDRAPKALVSQFLHMLAVQKFRPRILSNAKIDRLLQHLRNIGERVRGKQIIAHRLDVYKKLISQAPDLMLMRFRDWYEHIFHALMSDTKAIRDRALSLGFEAGVQFGASEQVTKTVSGLFNHAVETDGPEQRYGELFATRLRTWLTCKEEARQVPQVWACVLLFLRHQPRPLERWTFILPWLQLMKKCFNSTDHEIRLQANRAWTRLIFVISPCLTTGDSMVALLCEPIRSQLDRSKGSEQDTTKIRTSVIALYSSLLYYAIRPGVTQDTLDRYWKACIKPFFPSTPEHVSALGVQTATEILCSLLGYRSGKPWNPERAMEHLPLKPEEVPRLECRWIRARVDWISPVIEALLLDESWWHTKSEEPSPSIRVWKCFVAAIAEAGRKEIKVSPEAKAAVAELVSLLKRFLVKCKSNEMYARFIKLVEIASTNLGPLAFTETKLVLVSSTKYEAMEASSQYPQRQPKLPASASATTTLLQLVANSIGIEVYDTSAKEALMDVLRLALRSASSRRTRLRILGDACPSVCSTDDDSRQHSKLVLWEAIMQTLLTTSKSSEPTDPLVDETPRTAHGTHDLFKIFEYGLTVNKDPAMVWHLISEVVSAQISQSQHTRFTSHAVESLAKLLHQQLVVSLDENVVSTALALLKQLQSLPLFMAESGTRNNRGVFGLYDNTVPQGAYPELFDMTRELLLQLYKSSKQASHETVGAVLSGVSKFLRIIQSSSGALYALMMLEPGLSLWIADWDGRVSTDSQSAVGVFKEYADLWSTVVAMFQGLPAFNTPTLDALKNLLFFGLRSRHRAIANMTIGLWNTTFGLQEGLSYPVDIQCALAVLSQSTEILMSGVTAPVASGTELSHIEYLNTPADVNDLSDDKDATNSHLPPKQYTPAMGREPLADLPCNEQNIATPPRQKDIIRSGETPRLRHDNSQIEFAAITSSPPSLETIESHLLTEHQREVRDRQHAAAAAMFPSLRASPRTKSQEPRPELPRLQLRTEQDLVHSDIDDLHSPTLPSPRDTPYLGSSPTPSQKRQTSKEQHIKSAGSTVALPPPKPQNKQMQPDEQRSDDSTYFSSYGQTYGEELLAIYEEPIEGNDLEVVDVLPINILSSDIDEGYAEDAPARDAPTTVAEAEVVSTAVQETNHAHPETGSPEMVTGVGSEETEAPDPQALAEGYSGPAGRGQASPSLREIPHTLPEIGPPDVAIDPTSHEEEAPKVQNISQELLEAAQYELELLNDKKEIAHNSQDEFPSNKSSEEELPSGQHQEISLDNQQEESQNDETKPQNDKEDEPSRVAHVDGVQLEVHVDGFPSPGQSEQIPAKEPETEAPEQIDEHDLPARSPAKELESKAAEHVDEYDLPVRSPAKELETEALEQINEYDLPVRSPAKDLEAKAPEHVDEHDLPVRSPAKELEAKAPEHVDEHDLPAQSLEPTIVSLPVTELPPATESSHRESRESTDIDELASMPPSSESRTQPVSRLRSSTKLSLSKRKRMVTPKDTKPQKRARGRPRKQPETLTREENPEDSMEECIVSVSNPSKTISNFKSSPLSPSLGPSALYGVGSSPAFQAERRLDAKKRSWNLANAEAEDTTDKRLKTTHSHEREQPEDRAAANEERHSIQETEATSQPLLVTRAISAAEFMAKVTQLRDYARTVEVGEMGDDIMCKLMDVCKDVMDAKRRNQYIRRDER